MHDWQYLNVSKCIKTRMCSEASLAAHIWHILLAASEETIATVFILRSHKVTTGSPHQMWTSPDVDLARSGRRFTCHSRASTAHTLKIWNFHNTSQPIPAAWWVSSQQRPKIDNTWRTHTHTHKHTHKHAHILIENMLSYSKYCWMQQRQIITFSNNRYFQKY